MLIDPSATTLTLDAAPAVVDRQGPAEAFGRRLGRGIRQRSTHRARHLAAARGVLPDRGPDRGLRPWQRIQPGSGRRARAPAAPARTEPLISFSRSKLSVPWDPAFGSLLKLAEACDVPVSFGCRSGACYYRQSGLVIGKVSYQPKPLAQPPPGSALICCS